MRLPSLMLLAPLALALPLNQDVPEPAPKVAKVGKPAPAFSLNDHTGAKVSVGGEAGTWTVIACYPKAMTPG